MAKVNNPCHTGVIIVTTTGTDLDEYMDAGVYYFGASYTPVNIPAGVNGWLVVLPGTAAIKQLWLRHGTANKNDYQTYVRIRTDSPWGGWRRLATYEEMTYSPGDVATVNMHVESGLITDSGKRLQFSISLPRIITATSFTISCTVSVRVPSGGYALTTAELTDDMVVVRYVTAAGITVGFEPTWQTTVTNNIPVAVEVRSATITFT